MILEEMNMIGISPMHSIGRMKSISHEPHDMSTVSHGNVSREDCCAAIIALVECCSCPATKQVIIQCCHDLMTGHHDRH